MPIENAPQNPEQEPIGEPRGQDTSKPSQSGNGHSTKGGVPGSAAALGLDLNVSIMALTAVNPDGYQHLASINPVRGGAPLGPDTARAMAREMRMDRGGAGRGQQRLLHRRRTSPTRTRRSQSGRGPSRSHIAKIREVIVDCDIAKSIAATDAANKGA